MFELEKVCWKEYLKKTKYRRNKTIDFIIIFGISGVIYLTINIFLQKVLITKNISNKLLSIIIFIIFCFLYIIPETIGKICDKHNEKSDRSNMEELKKILVQYHCNIHQFYAYFNIIKENTKNKTKKLENNITTIFTFFLTLLFSLVNETNKLYNLMEIFYIFIAYHCFKRIMKILKICWYHYDMELILEKTNEQLVYLEQQKKFNIMTFLKRFGK